MEYGCAHVLRWLASTGWICHHCLRLIDQFASLVAIMMSSTLPQMTTRTGTTPLDHRVAEGLISDRSSVAMSQAAPLVTISTH